MKCIKCGNELPDSAKFCNICGAVQKRDIEVQPTPRVNAPRKKKSNNKVLIIILIALLVVGVCAGVIYENMEDKNKNDDSGNPSQGGMTPSYDDGDDDTEEDYGQDYEEDKDDDVEDEVDYHVEVETEIKKIRNQYNEDVKGIESGEYSEIAVRKGITAYVDGDRDDIVSIQITKGIDGDSYRRFYYFEDSELYFAYYEGKSSHRFYFLDETLIRWRYAKDSSKSSEAVNHDLLYDAEYAEWEESVLDDAEKYLYETMKMVGATFDMSCVKSVAASSSLSEYNMTHEPRRILDGDLTTAWVEGADGHGVKESVIIQFDQYRLIKGMTIYAGYHKNDELYHKNSRPAKITVQFSDGVTEEHTLQDVMKAQKILFDRKSVTKSLKIQIESVYPGNTYQDTVISELSIY